MSLSGHASLSVPLDPTGSSLPAQAQDASNPARLPANSAGTGTAMAGYCSIDGDLLLKAPSPVVVAAGDGSPAILAGEDDGAVIGVVAHLPNTCWGLDEGLVAVGIEDGLKIFFSPGNICVLVETVSICLLYTSDAADD